MWKDYSKSYLKNNRTGSISMAAAALLAAFFLSLVCSLFYNAWVYEVDSIEMDQGDWQGRLTVGADMEKERLAEIGQLYHIKEAVFHEPTADAKQVVDLYFEPMGAIYEEMPRIVEVLGLSEKDAEYHVELLSRYLIADPKDPEPPLLLPFYVVILMFISASLIMIIRNAFEVTMQTRVRQLGILSSIGATPRQIRRCLIQEAVILGFLPILLGIGLGAAASSGVISAVNYYAQDVAGRRPAGFTYHPMIFAVTAVFSSATVLISVWIPARKLSRMTPMAAIRNIEGSYLKKRRHFPILSWMFGIEGELAANALRAQRKSLWIGTASLLFSFLSFTMMLSFVTLSDISTSQTYFERYQDVWDVMVTVKDTDLSAFEKTDEFKRLHGAKSSVLYQKAEGQCVLPGEWQSEELRQLGGVEELSGGKAVSEGGSYIIPAQIVILDDESFLEFCGQIGVELEGSGGILLNRIWDRKNSHFREKAYVPFVREDRETVSVYGDDHRLVEIPILAYTQETPLLREEYADAAMVSFVPVCLWNRLGEYGASMPSSDDSVFIRILGQEGTSLEGLRRLQEEAGKLLGSSYDFTSENRIEERIYNDEMLLGMKVILGSFCGLLAAIGMANVFSYTLSFLRQRKREFAQYFSVGMTPAGMKKMFCIEALIIAGRPILITFPLAVGSTLFMISASHLQIGDFLSEAPVVPICIFAVCIAAFTALAYYVGGRQIVNCDLSEILKDDTCL